LQPGKLERGGEILAGIAGGSSAQTGTRWSRNHPDRHGFTSNASPDQFVPYKIKLKNSYDKRVEPGLEERRTHRKMFVDAMVICQPCLRQDGAGRKLVRVALVVRSPRAGRDVSLRSEAMARQAGASQKEQLKLNSNAPFFIRPGHSSLDTELHVVAR